MGEDETYETCEEIGESRDHVSFIASGSLSCFANDLWMFYWNNEFELMLHLRGRLEIIL